jgi:multiple antibiotic resistance protein
MSPAEHFLQSTVAILAIANPLSAAPIFLSVVSGESAPARESAARRAALAVGVILAASAVLGRYLLMLFGISFAAFRAGGGLVITLMGLEMLQGTPTRVQHERSESGPDDRILVPVAMPLIAGPGAITTTMALAVRQPGPLGLPLVLVAVGVTALAVWLTLSLSGRLQARIGTRGQAIFLRFMGLILVAVGAQLVLTGVHDFLTGATS